MGKRQYHRLHWLDTLWDSMLKNGYVYKGTVKVLMCPKKKTTKIAGSEQYNIIQYNIIQYKKS